MGIRYQKRIRLTKGFGLNISSRGVSSSYRIKHGTIGTRGFSIHTGIPGLSFRSSWGKSKEGLAFLTHIGAVYLAVIVLYNIALLMIYLINLTLSRLPKEKDGVRLRLSKSNLTVHFEDLSVTLFFKLTTLRLN